MFSICLISQFLRYHHSITRDFPYKPDPFRTFCTADKPSPHELDYLLSLRRHLVIRGGPSSTVCYPFDSLADFVFFLRNLSVVKVDLKRKEAAWTTAKTVCSPHPPLLLLPAPCSLLVEGAAVALFELPLALFASHQYRMRAYQCYLMFNFSHLSEPSG